MKTVFIVILNFNNASVTKDCLKSLEKISHKDLIVQVVVVDNSTKEKISIGEKEFGDLNIKLIDPKGNLGFTGGCNLGIRYAVDNGADYVVLLNNDTIVDENFVSLLVKSANKEKVGIVVPKIYYAQGSEYHKDRYSKDQLGKVIWYGGGYIDWKNVVPKHAGVDEVDNGSYDMEKEVEFASGCCMMLTKEFIRSVGLLDEKYFLYYEDADLSKRALNNKWKIIYSPKAIVWHRNAVSSGGSGSPLQDYYVTRNRMYYGMKYSPLRTKIALARESLRLFRKGREPQREGIKDFYSMKMGQAGSFS